MVLSDRVSLVYTPHYYGWYFQIRYHWYIHLTTMDGTFRSGIIGLYISLLWMVLSDRVSLVYTSHYYGWYFQVGYHWYIPLTTMDGTFRSGIIGIYISLLWMETNNISSQTLNTLIASRSMDVSRCFW